MADKFKRVGTTHKVKGAIVPCQNGLHLSAKPLDALTYGHAFRTGYPWHELKPGQSFFVPFGNEPPIKICNRVSTAATYCRERYGYVVATRKRTAEQEGEPGIRVWRIE